MRELKDLDPFAEENWEEIELKLDDIYDVVYGCIMSYYKDKYLNINLVKTDDTIILTEKNDDNDDIICEFSINYDDMIVDIVYETQKRHVQLENKIKSDKFKVFLGFRVTFDKYLKDKING